MKIREQIEQFDSYDTDTADCEIKLNRNESPFDLPQSIKQRILDRIKETSLNRYPSRNSLSLCKKLSNYLGIGKDRLIVGNGSSELISHFFKLFSGTKIVMATPTFSMYKFYGQLERLNVVEIPLGKKFSLPTKEMKRHLKRARIFVVCSPNNPTGNVFPRDKIIELLETGKPVILDEAYQEFSECSHLDLIDRYENLIVLRTFSKAFSLAGARIGYAVADAKIIHNLLKIKPPYNINVLSMTAAEELLEHSSLLRQRIKYIVEERERLIAIFEDYCYPSEANFVLMNLDLFEYLKRRGVLVRSFSGRLKDKIRVTIGTKEENDQLIKAIKNANG